MLKNVEVKAAIRRMGIVGYSRITPELEKMMTKYRWFFRKSHPKECDYPLDYLDNRSNPDYHIQRIKDCIASNTPVPLSEYEHLLGCLM